MRVYIYAYVASAGYHNDVTNTYIDIYLYTYAYQYEHTHMYINYLNWFIQ
jgi:hypothetical protein